MMKASHPATLLLACIFHYAMSRHQPHSVIHLYTCSLLSLTQAGTVFWNGRGDGDVRAGLFTEQQQADDSRSPACLLLLYVSDFSF